MHFLSRSCQKRVIRMGIKEFGHLKKSLSTIESNTKRSRKLKNGIRNSVKRIGSLKTEIGVIRPLLESAEQIAQRKELISKLEAQLERRGASVNKAVSEVKKKGGVEGFPNMMFKSAATKIKKKLLEKRKKGNSAKKIVMFLVLLYVIPNVYLAWEDHFLPWTCDNGEVIEQTSLIDGVNDCSDGSDEDEAGWLSLSRAEENDTDYDMGRVIVVIVLLIVWGALVSAVGNNENIDEDLRLYPGYAEAKKKNARLQNSLNLKEEELAATRRLIASESKELAHIGQKLPAELDSLENDLEKEEKKKSELESEAASVAEKTDALWEGIRHLLPHSNLLKSD